MDSDVGSFRKVILPSPRLFTRMLAERNRTHTRDTRAFEAAVRRALLEIEDALFDEAIDRRIRELAA